jgi:hypothetical protein
MNKHTTSEIAIVGRGTLLLNGNKHPIRIKVHSSGDLFPGLAEVIGDLDVMHLAFHHQKVKIEMFDTQFQVQTAGHRKDTGALLILAGPFLKGLHRCVSN